MVTQKARASLLTPGGQGDFLLEVTLRLGRTSRGEPSKNRKGSKTKETANVKALVGETEWRVWRDPGSA